MSAQRIGFQGAIGAYSEEASRALFSDEEVILRPMASFDDVFDAASERALGR